MTRDTLRRWAMAQTLAVLFCLPYTARYFRTESRYSIHWTLADGILLVALLLVIGLLIFFAARLCQTRKWHALHDYGFIVIFCLSLASGAYFALRHLPGWWDYAEAGGIGLWVVSLGLLAFCGWRGRARVRAIFRAATLILSPIILIQFAGLLMPPWYPNPREPFPESRSPDHSMKANVYILLFDELAYSRSKSGLPNLDTLRKDSLVFHKASSGAWVTLLSIPSFLWQTDRTFTLQGNDPVFVDKDQSIHSPREMPNLFSSAEKKGYRTAVIGFLHSFRRLLGPDVDYVRTFDFYRPPDLSLAGNIGYHLTHLLERFYVPFTKSFRTSLVSHWEVEAQRVRVRQTHEETLRWIDAIDEPTFALFHYSVPHPPYVFPGETSEPGPAGGYQRNVEHMDLLLGDILERLKKKGRYENSLVILTSDHAWRADPAGGSMVHVPLIIKPPFSPGTRDIQVPVNITELEESISRLSAIPSAESANEVIDAVVAGYDRKK